MKLPNTENARNVSAYLLDTGGRCTAYHQVAVAYGTYGVRSEQCGNPESIMGYSYTSNFSDAMHDRRYCRQCATNVLAHFGLTIQDLKNEETSDDE